MFHGGTLIFIQTWFSHINAYASICALHLDEYPNLAGRWRSISNKAIQPEVQLAGTLLQISCCFASAAAATLVLAFVSVCRAAASAAAAAARHAMCLFFFFVCHAQRCLLIVVLVLQLPLPLHVMLVVFVLFFSRTTLTFPPPTFSLASGRSPQTSRIWNGAYVATDVSTELE